MNLSLNALFGGLLASLVFYIGMYLMAWVVAKAWFDAKRQYTIQMLKNMEKEDD